MSEGSASEVDVGRSGGDGGSLGAVALEAQHGPDDLTVSVVRAGDDGPAISTDISHYVRLTAEQWRWLVEDAGQRVVEALR